jgi:hypothetical protein
MKLGGVQSVFNQQTPCLKAHVDVISSKPKLVSMRMNSNNTRANIPFTGQGLRLGRSVIYAGSHRGMPSFVKPITTEAMNSKRQHWCGQKPTMQLSSVKTEKLVEAFCASLSQAWHFSHTL